MAGLFQPQPIPSNPTSQEIKTGNVNTWAQPYVSGMLNAGQDLIATQGFTPLQTQSYGGASNIQGGTAGNAGLAASGAGITGALGAGNAYGQMATSPSSIQAYMSPYIQSSLNPQLQEISRQYDITGTQEMGNATRSGAFGGSREALMAAENQRNKNIAMNQAIGTGYNTAFNNAQQAQQYQNTLGLQGNQAAITGGNQMTGQGLGILGLQNQFGTQQQQYPYQQLNFMQNMLQGLPVASQTTQNWNSAPNVLSQIAGLGTTGIAAMKLYDYLTPKDPNASKTQTGFLGLGPAALAWAKYLAGSTGNNNLVPGAGGTTGMGDQGAQNKFNADGTPNKNYDAYADPKASQADRDAQNAANQEAPPVGSVDYIGDTGYVPDGTVIDSNTYDPNDYGGGSAGGGDYTDTGGGGGTDYTYTDTSGGGNDYTNTYADNSGGYDTSGGDFGGDAYAAAGGLPKNFKRYAAGGAIKGYAPGGIATLMNANKYTPAQIDSNVKAGGMPSAIGDLTKLVQANDRNNAMAAQSMAQPPAPTIADQIQTKSGQMEQQEIQQKLPLLIQALKAKISEAMQEGNMPLAEKYAEKLQQVQRAMQQPAQESPQASMPVVPQGIDQIPAQAAPAQMAQAPQQGINAAPSNLPATMAAGGIARFATAGAVDKTEADMNAVKAAQEAFKNEDYFGSSAASAKEYAEELKSQRDKAPYMALLSAGLGMMSGTSPYALANVGAGGKAGIDTLQKSQEQDLLNRKAILAQQVETDKAKSARGVSYLGSLTDTLGVGARSQTEANKLAHDVNKLAQDKTLNENLLANQLKIANINAASGNLSGKQKMEHLAEIRKELEVKLGRPPTTSEILKEYTASTTTAGETAESKRKYDVEKLMIDWETKIQYTANWMDLTPAQQEEMRNNKRKEINKNLLSQEANPTTPPPQAVPTSVTTAAGKTYNRKDYPNMTDAQWSAYVNSVKVK
jgi:hypothetical protein